MSKDKPVTNDTDLADTDVQTITKPPKTDVRVDEYAAEVFGAMGYDKHQLPPKLVELYCEVKLKKDKLAPSRLTPGEFAIVAMIAGLFQTE